MDDFSYGRTSFQYILTLSFQAPHCQSPGKWSHLRDPGGALVVLRNPGNSFFTPLIGVRESYVSNHFEASVWRESTDHSIPQKLRAGFLRIPLSYQLREASPLPWNYWGCFSSMQGASWEVWLPRWSQNQTNLFTILVPKHISPFLKIFISFPLICNILKMRPPSEAGSGLRDP